MNTPIVPIVFASSCLFAICKLFRLVLKPTGGIRPLARRLLRALRLPPHLRSASHCCCTLLPLYRPTLYIGHTLFVLLHPVQERRVTEHQQQQWLGSESAGKLLAGWPTAGASEAYGPYRPDSCWHLQEEPRLPQSRHALNKLRITRYSSLFKYSRCSG